MKTDRRQHPRYTVPQGDLGYLCDVPTGVSNSKWVKVNILDVNEDRPYLLVIPCKTVYDITALSEDQSFRGSESRLRGKQFGDLTKAQKRQLENLFQKKLSKPIQDSP